MRITFLILLTLLTGCGYHTPGSTDSWIGGDARILYVELFDNQTAEPYLENYLSDALVAELSRSRFVVLTEDPSAAKVRLVGAVQDFRSHALAYGALDQITNYRATMNVSVRLLSQVDDDLLWQETFQGSEDYLGTSNKNLQLEGERLAARQVAKRLAEDISSRLLNSF